MICRTKKILYMFSCVIVECRIEHEGSVRRTSWQREVSFVVFMKDDDDFCISCREYDSCGFFGIFECPSCLVPFSALDRIVFPVDLFRIFQVYDTREVHESVVDGTNELCLCGFFSGRFRDEHLKTCFDILFFLVGEFSVFCSEIVSREDFFEIGIPGEIWFSVSERENGTGSIVANSREFFEDIFFLRKMSVEIFVNDAGGFEEIAGSRIISHSLIVREECVIIDSCERLNVRKLLGYPSKISDHSVDLRLLEEDLREPDPVESRFVVEIVFSPGKVTSAVFTVPFDEYVPRKSLHEDTICFSWDFSKKSRILCCNYGEKH